MERQADYSYREKPKGTIIVTGGGTGGHLYPALAATEALRRENPELHLLYIGREHDRDRTAVEKRNVPFRGFPLEGLKRQITLGNIYALSKFFRALIQCWLLIKKLPRGVVFGVGGYVAAPAMVAGKLAGWKIALHEQNTVPGIVNRMLASHCDRVFVTYESTQAYWSGVPSMVTGLPLRKELVEAFDRRPPRRDKTPPFVLLIGGSQGARKMVEYGMQAFQRLHENGIAYRALIQTGDRNYEWASSLPQPEGVTITPFIDDMAGVYQEADLVISRAGSGSLAEIALWGLPSILIPYPYASENHQVVNARVFAEAGAADVIEEKDLHQEGFVQSLSTLLTHPEERLAKGRQAATLSRREAAQVIAKELLQLLPD